MRFALQAGSDPARYVDASGYAHPRLALAGRRLLDPADGRLVFVREPRSKRAHFVRYPLAGTDGTGSGPESELHFWGKRALAAHLAVRYGLPAEAVRLEAALLPGSARRADVAVCRGGRWQAYELQRASISLAELEARTADYREHGVRLVWVVTAERLARTAWLAEWLSEQQGTVWTLAASEAALSRGRALETPQGELAIGAQLLEEGVFRIERRPGGSLVGQVREAVWEQSGRVFGLKQLPLDAGGAQLAFTLQRLWRAGELVKWAPGQWSVPYHPDFRASGWRAWRAEHARLGWREHELSRRFHAWLWGRRIAAGADWRRALEAEEWNPSVRLWVEQEWCAGARG